MATIKDVARMAGVSVSTVSKFINGGNVRPECRESISKAIEALDFRVNPFARNLKTQRSRSVGILLPDMTAPFFGSVITALDKTLSEHGYHSLISCYSSNHGLERDNLRFLISAGIDGLIYIPEDLSAEEFDELTSHQNVPVVQVDRVVPGIRSDAVLVDNADSTYKAVSSLINKGHRRIAMVAGPKSVFTAKERQIGYLRALTDHGVLYDDALALSDENTFATGYRSGKHLLQMKDRPTAIVTTNYDITVGLITAAREMGVRVPEDVDIVGYDCVEVCTMMNPPLSVIQQPEQKLGQIAAQYILERMNGYTGIPRTTRLPCRMVTK